MTSFRADCLTEYVISQREGDEWEKHDTPFITILPRILSSMVPKGNTTKGGLNPPFMKEIFMQRNISYSLRYGDDALVPKVRTTSFAVESIAYLGNKLWQILPHEIKQSNSLPILKKQIICVGLQIKFAKCISRKLGF